MRGCAAWIHAMRTRPPSPQDALRALLPARGGPVARLTGMNVRDWVYRTTCVRRRSNAGIEAVPGRHVLWTFTDPPIVCVTNYEDVPFGEHAHPHRKSLVDRQALAGTGASARCPFGPPLRAIFPLLQPQSLDGLCGGLDASGLSMFASPCRHLPCLLSLQVGP